MAASLTRVPRPVSRNAETVCRRPRARGWIAWALCLLIVAPILLRGPVQFVLFGKVTGTAAIAVACYVVALGIVIGERRARRLHQPFGAVGIGLVIYAAYFLWNVVALGDGFGLNHDWRRWISEVAAGLVTYVVARSVVGSDGHGRRLRSAIVWLAVIEATVSLTALIMSGAAGRLVKSAAEGSELTRDYLAAAQNENAPLMSLSGGSFEHPNILGALLVLLVPQLAADTAVPAIRRRWWRTRKLMRAWKMVIVLAAILATLSRGAWGGLALGIGVFFLLKPRSTRAWLMVLAALVLLGVVSTSSVFVTRLADGGTVSRRAALLKESVRLIDAHRWSGYGLAFFSSDSSARNVLINPHDDYLVRLLGGGVIGLAAFLFPFVAVIARCTATMFFRKMDGGTRREAALTLWGCLAFMTAMAFNPVQECFPMLLATVAILDVELAAASRRRRLRRLRAVAQPQMAGRRGNPGLIVGVAAP